MDKKKAIEVLEQTHHIDGPIRIICAELQARTIAVEVMKRDIYPMKAESKGYNEVYAEFFKCPICGGTKIFKESNYCPDCGQRITTD
ncbi:hypothetical protein QMP26_33150 [Enterocloster clostridioformis]